MKRRPDIFERHPLLDMVFGFIALVVLVLVVLFVLAATSDVNHGVPRCSYIEDCS